MTDNKLLTSPQQLTLGMELKSPQGEMLTVVDIYNKKCEPKLLELSNGTRINVEDMEGWEYDWWKCKKVVSCTYKCKTK